MFTILAKRGESYAYDVAIIRNEHGVELNLVFNANAGDPATNILMDIRDKYPGYTHIALCVASIPETVAALSENGIPIAQGPVSFGENGQISVFVRDPDRNVIELRGREQRSRGRHPLRTVSLR